MSVSLRLAGFEVRDTLMWIYGSGFPKSHNVALGIDKLMGHSNRGKAIPTASRYQASDVEEKNKLTSNKVAAYASRSEESQGWEGWGTALKPAYEPIILIRKPPKGTVAQNVLAHGVGGINIDATRIPLQEGENTGVTPQTNKVAEAQRGFRNKSAKIGSMNEDWKKGRWPANIMLDEVSAEMLDQQSGVQKSGGPSRFFYTTKANKKEREAGLVMLRENGMKKANPYAGTSGPQPRANTHPTVKPIDLMRYLCKLVTPLGGTILDPFSGSGTTLCAAVQEGFNSIGIEREEEYCEIAEARVRYWKLDKESKLL
jgi:site-specific DNA-methyltransferase (adenine-specific)